MKLKVTNGLLTIRERKFEDTEDNFPGPENISLTTESDNSELGREKNREVDHNIDRVERYLTKLEKCPKTTPLNEDHCLKLQSILARLS